MRWPSFIDYEFFVKNAFDYSVLDPRLKNGKPMNGISGGFSRVYPVRVASQTFALRCWTKNVRDAKRRYKQISDYLQQAGLPYFVDFEYVSKGIRVNETEYPIIRMEWVEGVSLREFIKQNWQNPHIFKVVADEFQKMVSTLHKHQIAHGDLQDGNILLKRNSNSVEIKLIDYDSLFVPALRGEPEQILGLPEYQHPKRIAGGGQANKKVDYFSELVIYLSFLSLAEKPELWNQFKDKTDRGLLFSKEDFESPNTSDIFQELEKLSPDIRELAATLKDFCTKTSIDQLEPLGAVLPKPDANAYSNRGNSLLNSGQYNEALAEFRKAIALNPNYKKARYGIGRVYLHSQRYTDATSAFEQLIKDEPNYTEAHHGLGLAYFNLGDKAKAAGAANAALRIDPYYQPARELLDVIKTPPPVTPLPTTKSTSTSTSPTSRSTSSQPTRSNPLPDVMKRITDGLRDHWQSVAMTTLGLALVICFIALLIQMNTGNTVHSDEIIKLKNQLDQKESKIQGLTSSVQILENDKKKLSRENDRLQDDLEDLRDALNTRHRKVMDQSQQLSETEAALASWVNKNQKLQSQLNKKDTEIRHLQNDITIAQNENRRLQNQTDGSNSGIINQNDTVQRLKKEKAKVFNENQRLRDQNQDFIRQNRRLRNKNEALQKRLDDTKQNNPNQAEKLPSDSEGDPQPTIQPQMENLMPEPPKKIQEDRPVRSVDISRNRQGCFAFEGGDYDKAIRQFEQVIKADSELEIAHYNLGCTFLEMKDYPKAISAFDEAVAINHKFKEAHYNLGLVHLRNGAREQAKSSVERALGIDKNYQRARSLLAIIEKVKR